MKRVCIFTATGVFPFPLDMLRYDTCYPHQQGDVSEIERSLDPHLGSSARQQGMQFRVTLASQIIHGPTKDRWTSFGYTVTDVTMY